MSERARDLAQALERVAASAPESPAVSDPAEALTYRELLDSARALAASLPPAAANEDRPAAVALLMGHRASTVVAMIAANLAGRPWCALDPGQPRRRTEALLAAIDPAAIWASDADLRERLEAVEIEATPPGGGDARGRRPGSVGAAPRTSGALAALFATSGSSGSPRLVAYRAPAALERAALYASAIGAGPGDRFSLVAPLSTAASASALLAALLSGASVHLLDPRSHSAAALGEQVASSGITVWHSVPSLFRRLAGAGDLAGARLRAVRLGGEPVLADDVELARAACPDGGLLVTGYSITEANGAVTQKVVALDAAGPGDAADAGPALPGIELRIEGRDGRPLAPGEEGEIVVGGELLSAGYAGPDERGDGTRFERRDGGLVLRTGDRGVLRPDGSLEVRGRDDGRLKIRGHRVDPTEVEAVALSHRGVLDAALVPIEARGGSRSASALFAAQDPGGDAVTRTSLLAHLRERLPPAAMPAAVRLLDELPLTAAGKVDRLRLARLLDGGDPGRRSVRETSDPLLEDLLRVWRGALEIDELGADEDLFALGGDSLVAAEICAAVESDYSIPMEPATLLHRRTARALATYVRDAVSAGGPPASAKLLRLNAAGGEKPLFAIPGAGSDATALVHFAQAIGGEQPVSVIQLPGADGRSQPLTRMERIVEHCLDAIRRSGEEPPYRIAGTSFGGLVAYGVAAALVDEDLAVEYLGLFDTAEPSTRGRHPLAEPLRRFRLAPRPPARGLRRRPAAELRRIRRPLANLLVNYRLTLSLLARHSRQPPIELRFRYLRAGCTIAASRWTPPPLSIPLDLYRCESQPGHLADAPRLGWERHASEIRVRPIPSRHGRHIRPPAVADLAALVNADLARARERRRVAAG